MQAPGKRKQWSADTWVLGNTNVFLLDPYKKGAMRAKKKRCCCVNYKKKCAPKVGSKSWKKYLQVEGQPLIKNSIIPHMREVRLAQKPNINGLKARESAPKNSKYKTFLLIF